MNLSAYTATRLLAISVAALFSVPANASIVKDNFVFTNNSAVVANGSFSYDSSKTGLLTYADLRSFTINLIAQSQSYNLAFARSNRNYRYFGYNTTLNQFVPSLIAGNQGPYVSILSATNRSLTNGFFFDPLQSQSNLGIPHSNDGVFAGYAPYALNTATAFSVSPVPLPSAVILMCSAIGLWGAVSFRRKTSRT
ncbi:MAG: hypothetical protein ACYDGU_08550 [Acidiferrobacterales bacterium]